jgi:hypothetical protein
MKQNWEKFTADNFFYFFAQKLQFTYPLDSIKDFKATERDLQPCKEISQHFKT